MRNNHVLMYMMYQVIYNNYSLLCCEKKKIINLKFNKAGVHNLGCNIFNLYAKSSGGYVC